MCTQCLVDCSMVTDHTLNIRICIIPLVLHEARAQFYTWARGPLILAEKWLVVSTLQKLTLSASNEKQILIFTYSKLKMHRTAIAWKETNQSNPDQSSTIDQCTVVSPCLRLQRLAETETCTWSTSIFIILCFFLPLDLCTVHRLDQFVELLRNCLN